MTRIVTRGPISRRVALGAGIASAAGSLGAVVIQPRLLAQAATPVAAQDRGLAGTQDGLSLEIVEAFKGLPGKQALKLWAPEDAGRSEWSAALNPGSQLFIGSVFKALVLAECLRLEEEAMNPQGETSLATQLDARLAQPLPLDEDVFSLISPVFNPPDLTGQVTLLTALEAMISHSDNTATDMVLRNVGSERVQAFAEDIGLGQTRIPASTRQFFGYALGLPEWWATTWADFLAYDPAASETRPNLNDEITMASTPDDLVSFYARALHGEFFRYAETLAVFRAILGIGDAVALTMPLGANGFGKGGSIEFGGSYALAFAGGMYVPNRWVYFALLINWTDAEAGPETEVRPAYLAAAATIFTLVRDRLGA